MKQGVMSEVHVESRSVRIYKQRSVPQTAANLLRIVFQQVQ